MGSNSVEGLNFFQASFHQSLKLVGPRRGGSCCHVLFLCRGNLNFILIKLKSPGGGGGGGELGKNAR